MTDRYILILNGPNLNLVGRREPSVYGVRGMGDIISSLQASYVGRIALRYSQHNGEGEIIDEIQTCGFDPLCAGIVLNAGAYSHTSLAIADALRSVPAKTVEVHMSNIYAREEIRRRSMLSEACLGVVCGFGPDSYRLAVEALISASALCNP